MGRAAEVVAAEYHVSREAQDAFALDSHRKAASARPSGAVRRGDPAGGDHGRQGRGARSFARDEAVRADTSLDALGGLKPAFVDDGSGTVTAGNAPPLSDGASALVVASASARRALGAAPLARIVAQATSGLDPKHVLMTPVAAVRRVLEKAGWPTRQRRSVRDQRGVLVADGRGARRAAASIPRA